MILPLGKGAVQAVLAPASLLACVAKVGARRRRALVRSVINVSSLLQSCPRPRDT